MSETVALMLGALLTLVIIVGIIVGVIGSIVIALGVDVGWTGAGRSREARSRTSWSVRLPDGEHRVEVRSDLDYPILVYFDDVAAPIEWHGDFATFQIAGREGRLLRRTDWRAVGFGGVVMLPLIALMGYSGGPGRIASAFDLIVDGGDVEAGCIDTTV